MIPVNFFRKIAVLTAVWLFLTTAGSLPDAFGQESGTASAPASQPTAITEDVTSDLTTEAIDARIQRLKAATDIKDDNSELLRRYAEALEELKAADTSAAAAARFEQRRQQAPAQLAEIRARAEQARTRPASKPAEDVPADASLERLNDLVNSAEDELETRTRALRQVEDDLKKRSDRRTGIPVDLEAAGARLEEVTRALADAATVAGVNAEIVAARRTILSARRKAAEQQIRTYKEELRYWEALSDLLIARRDEARGRVDEAKAAVAAWKQVAAARRQVEIENQKRQAEEQLANVPERVRELVRSNAELAEERLKLATEIEELSSRSREATKTVEDLDKRLASLSEKVDKAGVASYIGPMLLRERRRLPDVRAHQLQIRILKRQASMIEGQLLEIQELRGALTDLDTLTAKLSQEVLQAQPTLDAIEVEGKIREVLLTRLDTIRSLRRDHEECWNDIVALNILLDRLVARTNSMSAFIDRHVLWVRSLPPLYRAELPKGFVSSPADWRAIGRGLREDAGQNPGVYLLAGGALLLWLGLFHAVRTRLRVIDERIKHPYSDSFGLTVEALGMEAFLVAPIPALILFLGARLAWAVPVGETTAYELAYGLSDGLRTPAFAVFALLLLWRLCRRGGVGEVQFQWGPRATKIIHCNLLWLVVIGGSAAFLTRLASAHPDSAWRDSVSRGAFLVVLLTTLYLIRITLHPSQGAVALVTDKAGQDRLRSVARFRYFLAAWIFIVLFVISAIGYHYTALVLSRHLGATLFLIVALVILRAMILRFVRVSQQKLAIARARKEMTRRVAEQSEDAGKDTETVPIEEQAFEIQAIDEQTFKLVRWLVVFTLTIGIWLIWKDTLPAFSFLGRKELWSDTVHLSDLLLALILGAATIVLATYGPRILELVLLARLPIEPSVRFAVAALVRYAIVITGLVLTFQAIGIGWQQVQWLAAAITVGLGFGLQEIFANFVSGLIILFERPVRIGDAVTVGDVSGRITRIRMRATTVTDWDNRELIVPNKEFITSRIMNWTLSSPVTRVVIPVGIAYGSDTALARELLLKVARESEYVMDDPAPSAIFRSFGSSSLDFELRVFIPKRDIWPEMIDDMHARIDEAFRQAKIEIAFPQRDVHVRSIRDVLPVRGETPGERSGGHDVVEGGHGAEKD